MPTTGATLLEQLDAAVNRHDVEGVMALMAEDCLFENTFPPPDGSRYACRPRCASSGPSFLPAEGLLRDRRGVRV